MKKGTTIRTSRGGALLWLVITGAFALLTVALLILTYFQNGTIEHLGAENAYLQNRLRDNPTEGGSEGDSVTAWPPFGPWGDGREESLRKKGLANPREDLIVDLKARTDLIPFEGVLGGTMGFYSERSIHPLTDRYLVAGFEDGHMTGMMLLKYEVEEGEIRWTVIDSYLE